MSGVHTKAVNRWNAEQAARAEAAFRVRLEQLGATLLEPVWLGAQAPHRIRFACGHEGHSRPGDIRRGTGVCRNCAHNTWTVTARAAGAATRAAAGESAFRARLAELGAELLEPQWLGATTQHACRCPSGHLCSISPHKLGEGRPLCAQCPSAASAEAERKFREAVARAGGTIAGRYIDTRTPVKIICPSGHVNRPFPTGIIQGRGICRDCAGKSPAESERRFRAAIAALGGTCPGTWAGSTAKIHCVCPLGHDCYPQPWSVMSGQGMCRTCGIVTLITGTWDVFYIVRKPGTGEIKFGISSGNPRPRLRTHYGDGYREQVLVLTDLPGTLAPEIESGAIAALALAGIKPLRGREHYGAEALAVVLDIADNYPRDARPSPGESIRAGQDTAI
jgi:hypothetical protein